MTACSSAPKPEVHSIKADFNIKVKDPLLKELTTATQQIDLEATGEFAPGSYTVQNTKITVPEGTTFHFVLKLPIEDPTLISLQNAGGLLETSHPLQAHGVSLPQSITLKNGQVSAEVDLVRTMGSFFFNLLQIQNLNAAEGGDVHQMIRTLHIDTALLNLRPDAKLKMGKHRLHVAADSSVKLTDLNVDQNLNYKGTCLIKINFAKDSAYLTQKVDALFNGGSINDTVAIERSKSILSFGPIPKMPAPRVILKDCLYKFGKDKTSSAHCDTSVITLNKFDWADDQHDDKPANYHFIAAMNLTNTHLLLSYPTYSVDAVFPQTEPASLQITRDQNGPGIDFATHDILAKTGDIKITRPKTSMDLDLTDAHLGSVAFSKSGDLNFGLSQGTSGLRGFEWSNGKRKFKLRPSGGATVSITKGMSLDLIKNTGGSKMQGTVPVTIKLGRANLANAKGNLLDFSSLSGSIIVDLGQEVSVSGSAAFTVAQCDLLGDTPAEVKMQGFRLSSGADNSAMTLNGCSILLPKGTIAGMIKKQLPDEKEFEINQEIFEEKKWRYKHGMITKLIVRKPYFKNLNLVGTNKALFSVGGDIEVDGTVDKTGILASFKKSGAKWETKPWSASSPCSGDGSITFTMVPNKDLAASEIKYDLQLQMPLPQNIDIDWHEVSSGLVRKAETSVISSYLNSAKPFHGTRTIPLDRTGTVKMFNTKTAQLQAIRITKFTLTPTPAGTKMDFNGEASL